MEERKHDEFKVVIYRNDEKIKEETVNSCFLATQKSTVFIAQCKTFDLINLLTNVSENLDEAIIKISKELGVSPLEIFSTIEKAKRFSDNA